MDIRTHWQGIAGHPMGGWRTVAEPTLPALDPERRLLWCGIGGSLLPSETLVRAFGNDRSFRNWVPLASPEPAPDFRLQPGDQLVLASKSGKTLELWTWVARLRALPGFAELAPPLLITQDDANPLATWGRANGCSILPIPVEVGGRFSAFTPIGTLPLAWMGRDAAGFLQGGRDVIAQVEAGAGPWHDRIATLRFVEDIPLEPSHPSWDEIDRIEKNLAHLKQKPVVLFWGDKDWCFTPNFRKRFEREFPTAEVHAWDDCGHYVVEDGHERIVPLLRNFFDRHGGTVDILVN